MDISIHQSAKLLSQANTIILTAHIHPDGDALGSLLALYAGLSAPGKQVKMLLDDEVPRNFKFLAEWDKIESPRNIREKADLLVVLDSSDFERIGKVGKVVAAPILNLDHHISNLKFAEYWHIDSQAAATGELVFKLLKEMQVSITNNMATALFTAIATDCGFFRYANTSAQTLTIASELVALGAKPHIISEYLDTKPRAVIELLPKVLGTLEFVDCPNGQIAALTLKQELMADLQDDTEGFINYPRTIEGVEIAIMFKEADTHSIRVSLRSKSVDVSQVALAFGGGGHTRAAGCTVTETLAEAKTLVINAAKCQLGKGLGANDAERDN